MIHEFVVLFRAMVPKKKKKIRAILVKKQLFAITFNAAADGSSGSLLNGFVFSEYKFLQCLVRTSPILNIAGAPSICLKEIKN